jgi:uncharacterized protein YecE (DUF72 family)
MDGMFYGGTSGLKIAIPKRDFPPEHESKSRLAYYAFHENSLEINSSFYKLPQAKTVCRWANEVPDSFRFTFKLWKEITHRKNLLFQSEDVSSFMKAIAGADDKRGALLVQFPPGLEVNAFPQLKELILILKSYYWPIAVEFRHSSWYNDRVYSWLNEQQTTMVIQDMPRSATPLEITADHLVYLRFHGPKGDYKGSYNEEYLYDYALNIREWLEEGKDVFAYFNNTAGDALANLYFLKQCLL